MPPIRAREETAAFTFGRFLLVSRLARGGMAEVYGSRPLGRSQLPRVVAVKRMLPDIAARGDFIDMFVDEAKLVSRLEHDNIVRSYEYGREAGSYYIAMEMLSGIDMSRVATAMKARGRPIPPEIVAWIGEQVCAGLAHAHALEDDDGAPVGLIHRDVTPHNLIVGFDGVVKIIDFGIAKSAIQSSQTTAGTIKGKVRYMSPEQATRSAPIDYRSDIFSTGVCLWEWLAGRRMFSPDLNTLQTLKKVRRGDFKPLAEVNAHLPKELTEIIDRALAQNPDERFQDAEEMRMALEAYRSARCAHPEKILSRWLNRELPAQRRMHEHRIAAISATPLPEDTIGDHSDIERAATECAHLKKNTSSFAEAPTEVFFSVDVELPEIVEEATGELLESRPTQTEASGSLWGGDESGVQTRIEKSPWRGDHPEVTDPDGREEPRTQTTKILTSRAADGSRAEDCSPSEDGWSPENTLPRSDTRQSLDAARPLEGITPPNTRRVRRDRPAFIAAAAVAAAALLGVGFHYAGATQAPSTAAASGAGVLQVRLTTEAARAAEVFVDGVQRGQAPLTLGTLAPGAHEIRITADGFDDLVEVVELAAGTTTIMAASLNATTEGPDLPEPAAETVTEEAPEQPEQEEALETEDELQAPVRLAVAAADEERVDAVARWARLQEFRARRARIAARTEAAPLEVEPRDSAGDVGQDLIGDGSRRDGDLLGVDGVGALSPEDDGFIPNASLGDGRDVEGREIHRDPTDDGTAHASDEHRAAVP
ncbi:MAG: serine/threonine protein kinase [Deltaproteobacteria bacterium]|nr:serine/threonine protein kinase [Deltaproteobacteria bacterium]